MNSKPDRDGEPEPPEESTDSTEAQDDVPAVKMESDPEWMDVIQGTVRDLGEDPK